MNKFLIIIFTVLNFNCGNAQINANEKPTLGFACYEEASQTKVVGNFRNLIKENNYKAIKNKLYSNKAEEKFLSVVTVEKLQSVGKIELSKEDEQKIIEIRNSSQLVMVCSGCTYFDKITLKQAFEVLESSAKTWLSNFF